MSVSTPHRGSLAFESMLFAGRLLTLWRRDPVISIQALVFPTFLLVTYKFLLGKSMVRLTGTDSLYSLVPMCSVAGAMFGTLAAALTISHEREWGILTRFWVLPVHRLSPLLGTLLAEATRTLIGTGLITAVGVAMGLRFKGGWPTVIPFLLVPVMVGAVFSMAVIAIAMRSTSSTSLVWLGVPSIGSVFSSSGVPPVEMLPGWMHPLINLNPMAPTIGSMRALALGEPALSQLLLSSIWAVGAALVFAPLAISGYRSAAVIGS